MALVQRHSPAPARAAAAGPAEQKELHRRTFRALGTACELQCATREPARAERFFDEAVAWVARFEAKFSRYRPESVISRINAAAGREWTPIDAETERIFSLADGLFFLTQGVLDPTALPLLRLWDFSALPARAPSAEEIAAARRLVGWPRVRREPGRIFLPEPGMALDLGGFGKEYAVDAVAELARAQGIEDALIDLGRDLRVLGFPPGKPGWHIGVEDPKQPGACWTGICVSERGVASSGDYRRSVTVDGRRYGHIVDPRSGWPVAHGCRQATVIASTCLEAGILSTAAFILGLDAGLALVRQSFGVEACLLTDTRRALTGGFHAYLVS